MESALLAFLSERGCSGKTQKLLTNSEGLGLSESALGPAMVTAWIEGEQKSYRDIDDEGWRALGLLLAHLHQALQEFPGESLPRLENTLRDLDVESQTNRLKDDQRKLAKACASAAVLQLQDSRLELLELHYDLSLQGQPFHRTHAIHNDFNANNYIFPPQEDPRILDWDRALVAPPAYEVVRCLNHLPLESPGHSKAFLQGYRECLPLDPSALLWAVHAAMVAHATKDWPIELALAGQAGAMQGLEKLAPMVSLFCSEGERLLGFFESRAEELI